MEVGVQAKWGRGLRCALGGIGLVLAAWAAHPALADVNGYIFSSTSYADNIFLLPKGAPPPGISRDDVAASLTGGGSLDVQNDHFQLNAGADVGQHWYTRNSFLNALGYDGQLALSERQKYVTFDLQAQQSQALSLFQDIRAPVRNIQNMSRTGVRLGLAVSGGLRIVLDAKFNRNSNSASLVSSADYNQWTLGAGLGYFSPSGNSVVFEGLRGYIAGVRPQLFVLNGIDTSTRLNYVDDTASLQLNYAPTPVTGFYLKAGYLARSDLSLVRHDTKSPVGSVRFSYRPDDVVSLSLDAGHQLSTQSHLLVSGVKDTHIAIRPALSLGSNVSLSYNLAYDQRSYGVLPQSGFGSSNTRDRSLRSDVLLSYQMMDHYEFGLAAYHEARRSNAFYDRFNDNGVRLTLTLRTARRSPPRANDEADDLLLP